VEAMNNAMVLRQLNYDLRIARNGLQIVKGQAHVVYQENQDLKREVDSLKVKLQNANEDKLATISAERKRWAREDFNALAIRDLEQQAKALYDFEVNEDIGSVACDQIMQSLRDKCYELSNKAESLKDQGK
jgi:hypothetical protein